MQCIDYIAQQPAFELLIAWLALEIILDRSRQFSLAMKVSTREIVGFDVLVSQKCETRLFHETHYRAR